MSRARPVAPAKKRAAKEQPDHVTRLRGIVDAAILAMEMTVAHVNGTVAEGAKVHTDENLKRLLALGEKAVVWLGHVRRADEAVNQAKKKLSKPAVIAWLRDLDEDERERVIVDGRGDEKEGSPFK